MFPKCRHDHQYRLGLAAAACGSVLYNGMTYGTGEASKTQCSPALTPQGLHDQGMLGAELNYGAQGTKAPQQMGSTLACQPKTQGGKHADKCAYCLLHRDVPIRGRAPPKPPPVAQSWRTWTSKQGKR